MLPRKNPVDSRGKSGDITLWGTSAYLSNNSSSTFLSPLPDSGLKQDCVNFVPLLLIRQDLIDSDRVVRTALLAGSGRQSCQVGVEGFIVGLIPHVLPV